MNIFIQVSPRQRLVAERMRRRWTQLEVAEQLGTTPGNVSRWERGITSPGPYFRRKLCDLFGTSAQGLGLTWDESDDTSCSSSQVSALEGSFQRNTLHRSSPAFTDHEDLLALLLTLIHPDTTAFPGVWTSNELGELNLSEQENAEQGLPLQWLQAGLNRVRIPANSGAMVLVILNRTVCSQPCP